jgi:hypothetical protein
MHGADFAPRLMTPAKSGNTEMTERTPLRACPFCGVATEVPHETQEGCIEALHEEIGRMRAILENVREPWDEGVRRDDDAELT